MSSTVFANKATRARTKSAKIFAPGKDDYDGTYGVFELCSNYDGRCRGGVRKAWLLDTGKLTLADAIKLLNKRLGFVAFDPPAAPAEKETT